MSKKTIVIEVTLSDKQLTSLDDDITALGWNSLEAYFSQIVRDKICDRIVWEDESDDYEVTTMIGTKI